MFTKQPYTAVERNHFAQLVAARLGRPVDSVRLEMIEVPTTSEELAARARKETRAETPPTVAQLAASFRQGVEASLRNLRLPPAQMIDYRVVTGAIEGTQLLIRYLHDRDISPDAQTKLGFGTGSKA